MTDEEVKRQARETLDRAKNKRRELMHEIRKLEAAIAREDGMILSCLAILDEIKEKEVEER